MPPPSLRRVRSVPAATWCRCHYVVAALMGTREVLVEEGQRRRPPAAEALTTEVFEGITGPFDPFVHEIAKPHRSSTCWPCVRRRISGARTGWAAPGSCTGGCVRWCLPRGGTARWTPTSTRRSRRCARGTCSIRRARERGGRPDRRGIPRRRPCRAVAASALLPHRARRDHPRHGRGPPLLLPTDGPARLLRRRPLRQVRLDPVRTRARRSRAMTPPAAGPGRSRADDPAPPSMDEPGLLRLRQTPVRMPARADPTVACIAEPSPVGMR